MNKKNHEKANMEEMTRRLNIIKNLLVGYKSSKYQILFDEEFEQKFRERKEVRQTGLKMKELYYFLCEKPNLLELDTEIPLSVSTVRSYLEKLQYRINKKGYIFKSFKEENRELFNHIKYSLEQSECFKTYVIVNRIAEPDFIERDTRDMSEGYEDDICYEDVEEYCYVLCFKYDERLQSIAEDFSYISSRITGITWGYGMVRIYCIGRDDFIFIHNRIKKIMAGNY